MGVRLRGPRDRIEAARPLTPRDEAELARRREKLRATLQDKAPWVPYPPLATGAEALRTLHRARHERR